MVKGKQVFSDGLRIGRAVGQPVKQQMQRIFKHPRLIPRISGNNLGLPYQYINLTDKSVYQSRRQVVAYQFALLQCAEKRTHKIIFFLIERIKKKPKFIIVVVADIVQHRFGIQGRE